MKIEFLGTGGATTIPRPSCNCRICEEARRRGVPYSRTGPAIFVHGPDILIDTPEEIKQQLNRAGIDRIAGCFYSHWHPDHTMGRRVWETRNKDWRGWPPSNRRTNIYLPQQVALDFKTRLGLYEHFEFMREHDTVQIIELTDGVTVEFNGVEVTPFRLAEDYVYAFLLVSATARVLIAPDELNNWSPYDVSASLGKGLGPLALAVLPMGVVEFDVFTGERRIDAANPLLETEATFSGTLDIVRKLGAERTILTHIEESDGLGYEDLLLLERRLKADGLNVSFAHDEMSVTV